MSHTGRFAPSPSGALHLGSMLAALGSFLDARHRGGRWLVRIEDLDAARVIPGSAGDILRTLERFGLHWDGEVEYQSRRGEAYALAIDRLEDHGLTFACTCSRRELASLATQQTLAGGNADGNDFDGQPYPGTCRSRKSASGPAALRFRVDETATIELDDRIQGRVALPLSRAGDVVIRRRDGVVAYQLAVVVDDAWQGVTDVVRGADLLSSTSWQMALQRALGLPAPSYAHLPLLVEPDGSKLAKSRRSLPVSQAVRPGEVLVELLRLLRQDPPADLDREAPRAVLRWAIPRWNPAVLAGIKTLRLPCRT